MEKEPIPTKETILKPKETKQRKPLTDEAREALAIRMRAINDQRILDTAERIKKSKQSVKEAQPVKEPELEPVKETPKVIETPKIEKKKRVIKVIELSDSEDDKEEHVIAIRKPKVKQPEYLEETPVRKPRITKPKVVKEPVATPSPIYQMPEPPRGRFL